MFCPISQWKLSKMAAESQVLVKDAARGQELQRLGLVPQITRRSAAIAFGWFRSN